MNRQSLRREAIAIIASILLLALGFLAGWLSREFLELEGLVLLFVIFAPIISYTIFSGRLKELRAGGLEAKFVDVAGQSVDLASLETIEASMSDMEYVEKADARELPRRMRYLDESKPIILALTLGREGYYRRTAWASYMHALSQFRSFKFVVFLDQENKFVAYMPAWATLQILRMDALGDEFVRIINEGSIQELQRYPGVVTRTISTKATNIDALREMTAQNLEALVVIDEDRNLKGVVEREQILSKLLLAMAR